MCYADNQLEASVSGLPTISSCFHPCPCLLIGLLGSPEVKDSHITEFITAKPKKKTVQKVEIVGDKSMNLCHQTSILSSSCYCLLAEKQ